LILPSASLIVLDLRELTALLFKTVDLSDISPDRY
jgi:hypothetical protein